MAKDLVSKIDNKWIHDASAIHKVTPNASNFSVQVGEVGSAYGSQMKVGMPSDYEEMLENLTTHLILKDTSAADIECYNKVQMDYVMTLQNASINKIETETGEIPEYDPYRTYYQNELVWHDVHIWRCAVRQSTPGPWYPGGWIQTSLMNEIQDMRGLNILGIENVSIHASVNRGDGVVTGVNVRVHFDPMSGRPDETYAFDSDGYINFMVDYGVQYTVIPDAIAGYLNPKTQAYTAGMKDRNIELQYRMIGSGIFVIDKNGVETDIELWNVADNDNARFIKFTNNQLCPGGQEPDNSIIISKNYPSNIDTSRWQIEYKDLPSLPNITSTATAEADFNGYRNCQLALSDCTTPNAAGKTFVDLYNDAHAEEEGFTPITIHEYLPAIYIATNVTETFMGQTIHGYLPSMGQLRMLCDNKDDIKYALQKIGVANVPDWSSDSWWSSTERSNNYSWHLNNGSHYGNIKVYGGIRIFPLFAI